MRGAQLFSANLNAAKQAKMRQATLELSVLRGGNITADVRNANLRFANLNNSNMKGVIWGNTIRPDATNSDAGPLRTCAANLMP